MEILRVPVDDHCPLIGSQALRAIFESVANLRALCERLKTAYKAGLCRHLDQETQIPPGVRLRRAIYLGSPNLVKTIISANPHSHDFLISNACAEENWMTSLHLAALLGNVGIAEVLIEAGHEANGTSRTLDNTTPIMLAARGSERPNSSDQCKDANSKERSNGRLEVVRLLLQKCPESAALRDNDGMDAFLHAVRSGSIEIVSYMLGEWHVEHASRMSVMNPKIQHHRQNQMSRSTIIKGHIRSKSTKVNIQPEQREYRPLSVSYLLNTRDRAGNTALHHASAQGHIELMKLLIAAGASLTAQNHMHWTPIQYSLTHSSGKFLSDTMRDIELNGLGGICQEATMMGFGVVLGVAQAQARAEIVHFESSPHDSGPVSRASPIKEPMVREDSSGHLDVLAPPSLGLSNSHTSLDQGGQSAAGLVSFRSISSSVNPPQPGVSQHSAGTGPSEQRLHDYSQTNASPLLPSTSGTYSTANRSGSFRLDDDDEDAEPFPLAPPRPIYSAASRPTSAASNVSGAASVSFGHASGPYHSRSRANTTSARSSRAGSLNAAPSNSYIPAANRPSVPEMPSNVPASRERRRRATTTSAKNAKSNEEISAVDEAAEDQFLRERFADSAGPSAQTESNGQVKNLEKRKQEGGEENATKQKASSPSSSSFETDDEADRDKGWPEEYGERRRTGGEDQLESSPSVSTESEPESDGRRKSDEDEEKQESEGQTIHRERYDSRNSEPVSASSRTSSSFELGQHNRRDSSPGSPSGSPLRLSPRRQQPRLALPTFRSAN